MRLCALIRVLSYVCASVLLYWCSHMCSCVLSYGCALLCAFICVCVLLCALTCVLSYACSHMCTPIDVLSYVCSHMGALLCVLFYVCSHDSVSFSQFHPSHCLGSLAGIIHVLLLSGGIYAGVTPERTKKTPREKRTEIED